MVVADNSKQFNVPGSIVRIKLINFMQYVEVEFFPGPNLNMIIGPNGSGKSSVVNAIALGLAGKPVILGRSTNLVDFIRFGEEFAVTEIELFKEKENIVIQRKIYRHNGRSEWSLNKTAVTLKQIEAILKDLQIQVGNLCQFLPQDRLHAFSKMNSQDLLVSTIEAVGDLQLSEKYQELKRLQSDLDHDKDKFQMKKLTLCDCKKKLSQMEAEIKAFQEREEIGQKIEIVESKKKWCLYHEHKRFVAGEKKKYEMARQTYQKGEADLVPLKMASSEALKVKNKYEECVKSSLATIKKCVGTAKLKSESIEGVDEEIEMLNSKERSFFDDERRAQQKHQEYQSEIDSLLLEFEKAQQEEQLQSDNKDGHLNSEDAMLELKRKTQTLGGEIAGLRHQSEVLEMERKNGVYQVEVLEMKRKECLNVEKKKYEIIRKFPNGEDALKAMQWIRENAADFEGNVYDPILLTLNVSDVNNAIYLENTIAPRDLVAFVCETAADSNKVMDILRHRMKLRVNVVQGDPNLPLNTYCPKIPPNVLNGYDFRGYLKDMLSGPEVVMSYLCRQYNLHNVGVFGPRAEQMEENIVSHLSAFFICHKRYNVRVSSYSGEKSTSTVNTESKNTLSVSLDKELISSLDSELLALREANVCRLEKMSGVNAELKQRERILESSKKQLQLLQQKKDWLRSLNTKLRVKKQQLQNFMSSEEMCSDWQEKKRIITQQKVDVINKMMANATDLKDTIIRGNLEKIRLELHKNSVMVADHCLQNATDNLAQAKESLSSIKNKVEQLGSQLEQSEREILLKLEAAQDDSKSCRPSKAMEEKFAGFPDHSDQLIQLLEELDAQREALDDIDPTVIREFKKLRRVIEDLDGDLALRNKVVDKYLNDITLVKTAWLGLLEPLVGRISEQFGSFFAEMGFVGEVKLHTGSHENDFINFGLDLLVKFRRDNAPLLKLTPFHQSGGERSVATALYILALQNQSRVPFRCVDEINQGMDSINERRIFEILLRNCSSTQYFLLTPKLLPDLKYNRFVNVLVVYNGADMCHYSKWSMAKFISKASQQQ